MGADVSLQELAKETKNYSGAEIEGVVRSATSFALNRNVDPTLKKPDPKNIKVPSIVFSFPSSFLAFSHGPF